MKNYLVIIIMFFSLIPIYAHVSLIAPQGGETFQAGDVTQIQWVETVAHDIQNWDLLFSADGGISWEVLAADIAINATTYAWTIPNIATNEGKIRVVQDNLTMDYDDTSEVFTIVAANSNLNRLFIPSTISGTEINLNFRPGQMSFYPGFITNTFGFNQDYLGPTLVLTQNDSVTLHVTNSLPETTTVHWHGMHVPANADGGPHTTIEAGATWSPSFTVLDHAATYWYHPHLHEHTEEHVTKGGAGFIIIRDPEEALLNLPRTYGLDDIPLVIQSRAFDSNKQFLTNTAADENILINGTLNAFLDIPAQVIRLRLLNGSTERVYNFGFQDNLSFHQIASDGGLLDAPISLTRLRLAPGERAEILLDVSAQQGQSINLISFGSELPSGFYGAANPSAMPMGGIPGYNNNILNGSDFNILQLNVIAATSDPIVSIPLTLIQNHPYLEVDANTTRSLTFSPVQMSPAGMVNGPFEINNASFNLEVINYEVPLNNTEIWELNNQTAIAHPFHIHDVQFYILDINGSPPPANMRGRKDVVLVPPLFGTVRFIAMFEDFVDEETPYMYHCHMLSHEDDGMMGQFVVKDNSSGIDYRPLASVFIYPNPTSHILSVHGLPPSTVELYNTLGQLMERRTPANGDEEFSMESYPAGVYYINIISSQSEQTYTVIKN
jgi:bilirubin oxidase